MCRRCRVGNYHQASGTCKYFFENLGSGKLPQSWVLSSEDIRTNSGRYLYFMYEANCYWCFDTGTTEVPIHQEADMGRIGGGGGATLMRGKRKGHGRGWWGAGGRLCNGAKNDMGDLSTSVRE